MANEGMLLMVGLGALVLFGARGGKTAVQRPEVSGASGASAPRAAFDIAGYINTLFGETITVPEQQPLMPFYPRNVVVNSSGVPAVVRTAAELITATTQVQIGGDGGETITASALAVKRQEQLDKQLFQAAANVQPSTWADTEAINIAEEQRQKDFAASLIAARREAQAKANALVVARTRREQENLAMGLNFDGSPRTLPAGMFVTGNQPYQPTINDDSSATNIIAGQDIVITATGGGQPMFASEDEQPGVSGQPMFAGEDEQFVISGGMDSPAFASEDEQPRGPVDYGYGAYYGGAEDE